MKYTLFQILIIVIPVMLSGQTNTYTISFHNAVHHEARITATFTNIISDTLSMRMSRTSPGRYALHEFAKNVYDFKATSGKGDTLKVIRPDPYQWQVVGHNGSVQISYTLFANRGDGTYSQVDETHAHLNIPATFIYVPEFQERRIEVTFNIREDLNWKVATQLPQVSGNTYSAPDLDYFMDSPVEISDFGLREFEVESGTKKYTIQLALHHPGTAEELNEYFEKVKKVVIAEKDVFGQFPDFDFGRYTFLACYIPNASGDGMEHRNSTVLTSTRTLAEGGMDGNIGTVSHEFFHAWNVERIRPLALKPFNYTEANMSGELWFAEGFTSYYTGLILCRAGLQSADTYVKDLAGDFNYVWNSPGRKFFNPIEMSYQAPFVDAATTVDPVNKENTFISYYSYGSVLGLALDLSLRQQGLNLDDYMKLMWEQYGRNEVAYTLPDLHDALNKYAGEVFGDTFFNSFIYKSRMPDYDTLFKSVGIVLKRDLQSPYFGAILKPGSEGTLTIESNPFIGSPAYEAGLEKADVLRDFNGNPDPGGQDFSKLFSTYQAGDTLQVRFERYGKEGTSTLRLRENPGYMIELQEASGPMPSKEALDRRREWLNPN